MQQLKQQLTILARSIQKMVDDYRPRPEKEPYFQFKWEKFDYSKIGIDTGQGRGMHFDKLNWLRAHLAIKQKITASTVFTETRQLILPLGTESFDVEYTFLRFVDFAIDICLTKEGSTINIEIDELVARCIHQLHYHDVNAHITIYLIGLTLDSESIVIDDHTILRRTTKDDITIPRPVLNIFPSLDSPFPTAVLEVKRVIKEPDQLQFRQDTDHYLDILKLFGAGELLMKKNTMTSDSLIYNIPTESHLGGNIHAVFPFYLDKAKEEKLKAFFAYMKQHSPDLSGMNRAVDRRTVAFDRYIESCLELRIFEKKVMYAVMGLEALYLQKEMSEINYKLCQRCAKSMSVLGFNPLQVKDALKAGYTVRSTFAHGDHISKKEMEKYNTSDDKNIATQLCNYLRLSIIAYIILKLDKEKFIKSLDNSMLIHLDTVELQKQFSTLQQYIAL